MIIIWWVVLYGVKHYFWDDPFLFRECADGLFRRCVPGWEVYGVLTRCHNSPYGGHHGPTKTVSKIKESGFYWPMFKDSHSFVQACDSCQRIGNISRGHEMPQTGILEVEIFDVGVLIIWDLFPPQKGINISLSPLIMYLSGLKPLPHLPMMPR